MENLAGHRHATEIVKRELTRCGIDIVETDTKSEVPSNVTGRLGNFTFERAWYYYIVIGKVPLEVAKKLYADPIGKTDIRVAGHCGCPPPEEWCDWRDEHGNILTSTSEITDVRKHYESLDDGSNLKEFYKEFLGQVRALEDIPQENIKGFVESYHIDSELGLYIFTQTLKQEGLV